MRANEAASEIDGEGRHLGGRRTNASFLSFKRINESNPSRVRDKTGIIRAVKESEARIFNTGRLR